jgi:hypothetical protein
MTAHCVSACNPSSRDYSVSIRFKLALEGDPWWLTMVYGPSKDVDKHVRLRVLWDRLGLMLIGV